MNTKELLKYLRSDNCTSVNYVKTLNEFNDLSSLEVVYNLSTDTLFVGFERVTDAAQSAVKNIQEQFKVISDSYLYNTTTVFKDDGRTSMNFPLCYGMWDEDFDAFSIKTDFTLTLNKILKNYLSGIYSIKYTMHLDDVDELVYVLLNITLTKPGETGFTNKELHKSFLQKLIISDFFNKDLPVVYNVKCTSKLPDIDIFKKYLNKNDLFNAYNFSWDAMRKIGENFGTSFKFNNDWKKLNNTLKENFNNIHKDVASFLNKSSNKLN